MCPLPWLSRGFFNPKGIHMELHGKAHYFAATCALPLPVCTSLGGGGEVPRKAQHPDSRPPIARRGCCAPHLSVPHGLNRRYNPNGECLCCSQGRRSINRRCGVHNCRHVKHPPPASVALCSKGESDTAAGTGTTSTILIPQNRNRSAPTSAGHDTIDHALNHGGMFARRAPGALLFY